MLYGFLYLKLFTCRNKNKRKNSNQKILTLEKSDKSLIMPLKSNSRKKSNKLKKVLKNKSLELFKREPN